MTLQGISSLLTTTVTIMNSGCGLILCEGGNFLQPTLTHILNVVFEDVFTSVLFYVCSHCDGDGLAEASK